MLDGCRTVRGWTIVAIWAAEADRAGFCCFDFDTEDTLYTGLMRRLRAVRRDHAGAALALPAPPAPQAGLGELLAQAGARTILEFSVAGQRDEAVESRIYQPHNIEKICAWGGFASVKHVTKYIQPGIELITLDPKRSASIVGGATTSSFQGTSSMSISITRTFGTAAQRWALISEPKCPLKLWGAMLTS